MLLKATLVILAYHCATEVACKPASFYEDNTDAVQRLRQRLADHPSNTSLGVIMYSRLTENSYSSLTIPVWRAYCKQHGFDFFLQEESLVTGIRDDWTRPRLLIELADLAKWKYSFIVDASSLPINLKKSWQDGIREHLRHKRYKNDKARDRLLFCPWDCEAEYQDQMREGACYGPQLSGCILHSQKRKEVKKFATLWLKNREEVDEYDQSTIVRRALEHMKKGGNQGYYDRLFWKDVQKEIGRRDSNFVVTFSHDETHGWDVRKQVEEYLVKNKVLGEIVNQATGGSAKRAEL